MFFPVCQKCNSTISDDIPSQAFMHRLLKLAAGFQQVRCGNCGSQWAALNVFDFSIRMVYLLLVGEICYLLWNFTSV